jgi:hypothetical protein
LKNEYCSQLITRKEPICSLSLPARLQYYRDGGPLTRERGVCCHYPLCCRRRNTTTPRLTPSGMSLGAESEGSSFDTAQGRTCNPYTPDYTCCFGGHEGIPVSTNPSPQQPSLLVFQRYSYTHQLTRKSALRCHLNMPVNGWVRPHREKRKKNRRADETWIDPNSVSTAWVMSSLMLLKLGRL